MRDRIRRGAALGLSWLGLALPGLAIPTPAIAQGPAPIADAMPYTLTFTPRSFPGQPPLPAMQNYVVAGSNGKWLLVGGRIQGLHTFGTPPARNFPPSSANRSLVVIDPVAGRSWSLPLAGFPPAIADPLGSTGLQGCYDPAEDMFYLAGGYGLDSASRSMVTFPSLIRIPLGPTIDTITSGLSDAEKSEKLAAAFAATTDPGLAVTGGSLRKVQDRLYLAFGQTFTGDYYAFGSGSFTQVYTEAVRVVNIASAPLRVLSVSNITSGDASHPYHRRDGSFVDMIDPDTGQARFLALGGVFKPGSTLGYGEPIAVDDNQGMPTVGVIGAVSQRFSQYECPIVPVYDPAGRSMYFTCFGGLSLDYYAQTPMQKAVYDLVTAQDRSDGMPFIADISTLALRPGGKSDQYLHLDPIAMTPIPPAVIDAYFHKLDGGAFAKYEVPGTNLLGSSVDFWGDLRLVASGKMAANGVIRLDGFQPGESAVVGYVFGGIAAVFPYALAPNNGTYASNTLFAVTLTKTPSPARPASAGTRAAVTSGPGGLTPKP